jgi:putative aldouronate transport system permease protein
MMKHLFSSPGGAESRFRNHSINTRIAFFSTLLGAVCLLVFSLTPWLYSPVVGRVTPFGLLGKMGTGEYRLENYDAFLGFTRSVMNMYSIVRSFFFVLSVLLLISFAFLVLSLLFHRSKKSAPFAYWGFGLAALVSTFFMFEIAGIASSVEDLTLTRIPSAMLLTAVFFAVIRVAAAKVSAPAGHASEKLTVKKVFQSRHYYALLLPAIVHIAVFSYAPMYGVQIAFRNFMSVLGFLGSPWVGFQHFWSFFTGAHFTMVVSNTLILSVYTMAVNFPLPIILALMINELKDTPFRKGIQTTLYAPHFISTVVLVGMINVMFSPSMGIVNTFLDLLGFERIHLLMIPESFRHVFVWSEVWQRLGWSSIIYVAALSGVDPQLHEAATIDGASRLQRVWHINLPTIKPTIVILFILAMGGLMTVGFDKVFLMQNPLNLRYSQVIATFVYERGLLNRNFSYASAVGLFNNTINIAMVFLANYISRKVTDSSLF